MKKKEVDKMLSHFVTLPFLLRNMSGFDFIFVQHNM